MAQSGPGRVYVLEDFIGVEWPIAETGDDSLNIGQLRVIGDGHAETDSGVVGQESDAHNGVVRFTVTDEDKHALGWSTALTFDVALMGPIIMETRIRFIDMDTKDFFFGLSDVNADDISLEDDVLSGATETMSYTASDLCGFYLCSELTDDEDWHAVYEGGTTAAETDSTAIDLDADAVAGDFQVLRVEVDPNGDARWLIDGILKKSVSKAVSTTTDMAVICVLGNKANTSNPEDFDCDYALIDANRDWTI